MSTVVGQGTTFNLPNYHGELFVVTPTETPFLSAIGGFTGAKMTTATEFEWQTVDRRASSANNVALEGATAPDGAERARGNVDNVVEVHQSAIEVSYTKLAASGNFAGANIAPQSDDVVLDELTQQTMAELESMAVDIEKSFLTGTYQKPSDNTSPRQTQGILTAIQTNVLPSGTSPAGSATIVASTGVFTTENDHGLSYGDAVYLGPITSTTGISAGTRYYVKTVPSDVTFTLSATLGGAALTLATNGSTTAVISATAASATIINNALMTAFDNGAKLPQGETVLLCSAYQAVQVSAAYATPTLNWPTPDRNIGGVNINTVVTPFGVFGVMVDRWAPIDQIGILDLSVCAPVFLNIPGKGLLFVEELALVGSSRKFQLYGEIGLEYGPETYHALITELA